MTHLYIREDRAPQAGDVRALGYGDQVTVWRSAVRRGNWSALALAAMIAYARGAHVTLADDIEPKELA